MRPNTRAAALLLLTLPSCAAIFDGSKDEVTFTSEPAGAQVLEADQLIGVTPCSANVSKKLRRVTFKHAGYPDREVPISASWGFGWFLMDLLFTPGFGLSGMLVDGISGAWMDPQALVHCDFNKPSGEPAAKATPASPSPVD